MILVTLSRSYANSLNGCGEYSVDGGAFLNNPEKFKCILFTGGEDVGPERYNDTSPKNICYSYKGRDDFEFEIAEAAIKHGIPMVGICRGLQLLNVVAGGRLMHDITNHAGSRHEMTTIHGETFIVNSLHHQMVIPPDDSIVLGWSKKRLSSSYIGKMDEYEEYNGKEVEAACFPSIKGFGVQYHPEMMPKGSAGYMYFNSMVREIITTSFDSFVERFQ